ncbi:MAG: glycosyltransferase family 4 protein [Candidatus Diapherotrites archaeon]|nr:glycosyltransferase family 4 protein [Candidatus Micrarchaeota archaeon]MBU1939281.1 glycosyltransferase family 4 protein [Candidatus Micrarchaeota archaeon]
MAGKKILFLSSYFPRECGLATFTKDISDAIKRKAGGEIRLGIIAMDEHESTFRNYPENVLFTISEQDRGSYEKAAKRINAMKGVDVLNIQHEFGLFGGDYGEYLLRLMELVDKKIITTLHTVLEEPEQEMRNILREIARHSEIVVVMTEGGKKILAEHYGISGDKVRVIMHGVPAMSFGGDTNSREKYGFEGRRVLLTFGLLSRGKGIEKVIRAMPKITERFPDCMYVVLGETHPKVRAEEGEEYRNELKGLVERLGMGGHVRFWDKFLSIKEITDFLQMAEIYFAPSLDPKQITSGTVSYALGAGKAIIASNNKYNEEVLAEGRGIIVRDNSPAGFARKAKRLLSDDGLRMNMGKNAFEYSRKMVWPNVSIKYIGAFQEMAPFTAEKFGRLPRISFRHFSNMTDDFGMIQFANYTTPNIKSGYTLDDNARALVVAAKGYEMFGGKRMLAFANRFLNFIETCQMAGGNFHNLLNGKREFIDRQGSEDSFGRALWALGSVCGSRLPNEYKERAGKILENALGRGRNIKSPRAQAHAIMGISGAHSIAHGADEMRDALLESLLSKYDSVSDEGWKWFEPYLTYDNSKIPEALFESLKYGGDSAREIAKESLSFLTETMFINGMLVPIGQEKWYIRGKKRGHYDQQPIEAAGMTAAYLSAYGSTGEKKYLANAHNSFDWFLGKNSANMEVYDEASGGCFDGITRNGVNANEGAESTVSYLLARLSI